MNSGAKNPTGKPRGPRKSPTGPEEPQRGPQRHLKSPREDLEELKEFDLYQQLGTDQNFFDQKESLGSLLGTSWKPLAALVGPF